MGAQVTRAIVQNIKDLQLIDTSQFFQSIKYKVRDDTVIISSDVLYAYFLEYGTLEFGERFSKSTKTGWPEPAIKKKDMSKDLRAQYPRGMAPFAPFRRTIFNRVVMQDMFAKAVESALK